MVAPLVPMFMARVTCPHCEKDTVAARTALEVGSRRACAHCGKVFVIREVRGFADTQRRRPAAPRKGGRR